MYRTTLFLSLLALFSCMPSRLIRANDGESTLVIALWVPAHPKIPKKTLFSGCDYWRPMGVRCVAASSADDADVVVHIDDSPCAGTASETRAKAKKDGHPYADRLPLLPGCKRAESEPDEGDTVIVGASRGGRIDLYPNCLSSFRAGKPDLESIRFAMAHELGHEMGIAHVPATCGDPCIAYAKGRDGEPICGEAVMNPSYAEPRHFSPVDATAFARHRRDGSLRTFRW